MSLVRGRQKKTSILLEAVLVVPQGFEPRLDGPKPSVLPLHHGTNMSFRFSKALQI